MLVIGTPLGVALIDDGQPEVVTLGSEGEVASDAASSFASQVDATTTTAA